jgi:hypothetical protein
LTRHGVPAEHIELRALLTVLGAADAVILVNLYNILRVSTVQQTTANQECEVREVASRMGWEY